MVAVVAMVSLSTLCLLEQVRLMETILLPSASRSEDGLRGIATMAPVAMVIVTVAFLAVPRAPLAPPFPPTAFMPLLPLLQPFR